MRELTTEDKGKVESLVYDTAKAVARAIHEVAEQFLPRVREVHIMGCPNPTHPEDSLMVDAELNAIVATGVVFSSLLQALGPKDAAAVARAVSTVLGENGAVTLEHVQAPEPKAKA